MTAYEVIMMLLDMTVVPLTIMGILVSFVMYNAQYNETVNRPNYASGRMLVLSGGAVKGTYTNSRMNSRNTYSSSKKERERRLYCNKVTSIKKIYYKRKKRKRLKRKNR